jgi:hypothetical protein
MTLFSGLPERSQQPYQRGALADRLQSEREAATVVEFNRHKRVELACATLLDGIAKHQAEGMARNVYDRTGATLMFETVHAEIIAVAEALREQILSPADNDARRAREAAEAAGR